MYRAAERRSKRKQKPSQPKLSVKVKAKGRAATRLLHKLGIAEANHV